MFVWFEKLWDVVISVGDIYGYVLFLCLVEI